MSATMQSVDKKVREVRMNARKRGGNVPRTQRRTHAQIKAEVFGPMQVAYHAGIEARLAVRVKWPDERWHESKKDARSRAGGEIL